MESARSPGTTVPRLRTQASEAASEVAFALLDGLWSSPIAVGIFDRALRFVQVNEALAAINGLPPERHVGIRLGDLPRADEHAEPIARIEARLRDVFSTGRAATLEVRSPGAEGGFTDWRCAYYPVLTAGGDVRAVCAVVADVTEERDRQAGLERARREAERGAARVALLQDVTAALSAARTVPDVGRVVAERVGLALGASAASIRRVDADRASLVTLAESGAPADSVPVRGPMPIDAALPVGDAARRNEAIWLPSLEDVAARYPELAGRLAGTAHRAFAAVPLDAGGKVIAVLGLLYDAPQTFDLEERALVLALADQSAQALDRALLFEESQRLMEEATRLYDSERRLREEAERARGLLDAIFENAPIGIGFFDRDARFVRVNPRLAEMNGVPVEAHPGRTIPELLPGIPLESAMAGMRQVIDTGRPLLDVELAGETPAAPGKTRHWLESWYPVRAGGEVLGVGALVREVTAERASEEFQRNVLGIVGHDLRNPLAAVVASAQLLRRVAGGGDVSRLTDRILANAGRMDRIIAVLVDYARVRGGQRVPIRRRTCELGGICRTVAEECEASHAGREVVLRGEGDATGQWDPDRIGQVIANLLSNALDYSPPATPVEVVWRATPGEALVEVANEGPPIPAEILPRLFEPFRRAERGRSSRREGLGLGLFIAQSIATAHGGRIEVRSAPGERTVFVLRLPM